jgi:hypothetical protein
MFGLLRAAFTLLICVLVVGFFLGWFRFNRTPADPQSNNVNINVSVDRTKMGNDLQRLEQKVSKGIQDFNNQPPGPGAPNNPTNSQPRLSLGPVSFEPAGQFNNQPTSLQSGVPSLSLGPITVQPVEQTPAGQIAPSPGQPQLRLQTPDYQFTLPLSAPPPGEGR